MALSLAVVGEALISASVEILLNRIASREFREFFSNTKLNVRVLEELNIKLLELKCVLNDAEEKQITDREVKAWLDELKDAVYDAEDLLDEINTESLRCKVEGESKKITGKFRSLLFGHSRKFYTSMNSKLKQLCERLELFVNRKDNLGLQSVSRRVSYRRATDSLVESVIIARSDEKEKLLKMLVSDDEKNDNTEVITICGMGGLGKTTLAQSLYNDIQVKKHFDLTGWAWVSDDFDDLTVTKKIVESLTSKDCPITNVDVLRVKLMEIVREKKFLLVLDDLWNDKYNDWNRLVAPFRGGKKGSRIIVTTREERVAQRTHTLPICRPKLLNDDNCWQILASHAFGDEGYDKYPGLEEIGRQIAIKCNGLPLAAKTLGGLLRSNVNAEEWNRILSSNLWAHGEVMPALRISYFHLPAHIKRCFSYCSIFPKQHLFDRKELILLWMAEGFLQQIHQENEKAMESAGDDCFNELLSRYLIEKDITESEEKFRMHDLIYELATLVSGKSCVYFERGETTRTVRHLAFRREMHDFYRRFEGMHESKCLRTFLPQLHNPDYEYHLSKTVSHDWLPKLRCLRSLSLCRYKNITALPNSIGNLVLLRYLDLSYTSIEKLPDETFTLYNLQTLKLSNCKSRTDLPGQIGNLVNLRHLDTSDTYLKMPAEICKLQDLRTLTSYVVGKQDETRIRELRRFPRLQGKLSILELQNIVCSMDAFQADLKTKEKIEELNLEWGSGPQDAQIVKDVLDKLRPSTNLKKLNIRSFGGTSFPEWMGDSSYSKVTILCISDCNYCSSFPPFGQLPSLKELVIKRMKAVKIVGHEFYSNNGGSPPFQPFPLLESLQFEELLEWEQWLPFKGEYSNFPFPCLKRLCLYKCPKLRGSLPRSLPSLKEVSISECDQLEAKSCDLHWNTSIEVIYTREVGEGLLYLLDNFSCQELRIEKCDSLQSLPLMMTASANCFQRLILKNIRSLISFPTNGLPTSLKSLEIENCRNLEFLSHETWHKYTSLERLRIWDSCCSLTSFPLDSFPALEYLHIHGCPRLEVISTQGRGAAPKLVYFIVADCEKLKSLSEQIDLPALKGLWLYRLPEVASLFPRCLPSTLQFLSVDVGMLSSMSKHDLDWLFQCLTSLSCLRICGLGEEDLVNSLLQQQLLPTSLQSLCFHSFDGLKLLEGKGLQHLTSLQKLHVWHCRSLESLPEDQLPPSLELLSIHDCPSLAARYVGPKGKQWSKIDHIHAIQINGEVTIR